MMWHTNFEEKYSLISLVIEIVDFLNVWIVQDKEAFKEFISKKYKYVDLYYRLGITLDQKVMDIPDLQYLLDYI